MKNTNTLQAILKSIKQLILLFLLVLNYSTSHSQTIINGSFETNSAVSDLINLTNASFNATCSNVFAFGTYGDIDLVKSSTYCGGPQNGNWYIALTGNGTDAFSLKLSAPLVQGTSYLLSFYDHSCGSPYSIGPCPVEIGISGVNNNFGSLIYTAPLPIIGVWTKRTVLFTAPSNANYLTVQLQGGALQNWTQLDNFEISQQALPIELLSLTGFNHSQAINLEWTTASEINNERFEIEKSRDGFLFEAIGTMPGAGNSTSLSEYSFCDHDPYPEFNYYRLRQVDFDGNYAYSSTICVKRHTTNDFSFNCYINKQHRLSIFFQAITNEKEITISILDISGKIIYRTTNQFTNTIEIDQPFQSSGIYILEISSENILSRKKILFNNL
ncbi:MAG: T9SS type A sorting domain-containing protein [Bacteroidetes bacterium]|nr:T9SS type A sorting domain-containing protein [Bacteroidota bacterium]